MVCFVAKQTLNPPIEGNHVASTRIIEASLRAGINAKVVTVEPNTRNLETSWNAVVINSKTRLQENVSFSPSLSSYLRGLAHTSINDLLTSVSIASHIKSFKYDLIHVLNINKEIYLFAHSFLRVKKPLLLHFYHSPLVLTDDVFLIRNIAMRIGLYGRIFSNHALTVNLSLARFLVKKLGVDQEHVHYAPYPIDTETFKPFKDKAGTREKCGLPYDRPILAYVGSLHPARGIFNLMKSFRHVLTRFPKTLLLISQPQREGEDVYLRTLQLLIQNFKIGKNVVIRGPSSQVEEIFNLADIVVLPFVRPYWVDPPLVLLEAMSTGASVITTSVGSIGEITKNYENVVLTKPDNPVDLANKIIELLEDTQESRKIGESARKTIVQNYSYEKVGERLSKIYDFVFNQLN